MSFAAEEIIANRKIRRKLGFWRISSLALLGALVMALFAWSGMFSGVGEKSTDHIARVKISGVILSDPNMLELLNKIGTDERVKAVIVEMASPGGSTVGGEELYNAMRKLSAKKPVATNVGSLAASAGYMIAIGTDYIVARRTSIVGSIGVLFQYADASKLLDTIGVKVETVKSAPLKAEPSPFHPASEEARQMIKSAIDDTFTWFKNIVAQRRALSGARVDQLADGSIFTGKQALDHGLIDAIGDQEMILEWFEKEKDIQPDLKVVDWKPSRDDDFTWAGSSIGLWLARQAGFNTDSASYQLMRKLMTQEPVLDGLVSRMINLNPNNQ